MNSFKGTALAVVILGALAAGAGGLAWVGLREPTGDPQDPSTTRVSRPVADEVLPRNGGPGPEARDTADIRGQWEVLYVAGTVAGKREGYPMPNLIVPATDNTIDLPSLTGKPKDPLNYLGAMSYTLDPGLREADGEVQSAEKQLEWVRIHRNRISRAASSRLVPEARLIDAKTQFSVAEPALRNAERRLDERRAAGSAEESRIDLEFGPGGGKALRGIYRLHGDILTICYDEADRGRPETFADNKPSEHLIILRRLRCRPRPRMRRSSRSSRS